MKDLYSRIVGLELMKEFDGIAFFLPRATVGTHRYSVCSRKADLPRYRKPAGGQIPEVTALHHFAFEIDKAHHQSELERLTGLGLTVTTATHRWCHWRSIYVLDPEENVVELVCYDESVK
jgi:catechol-2,3-dioxygenase